MQFVIADIHEPVIEKTTRTKEGYYKWKRDLTNQEFKDLLNLLDFDQQPTPLMSACMYYGYGSVLYHIENDDEPLCGIVGPYMNNEDGYFGLADSGKLCNMLEKFFEGIEPEFEKIEEQARWETVIEWDHE